MASVAQKYTASRVSASVRLILAMFRLYADIETGFGRAVLDILKKQYPDAKIDINPATIGHKMMAIARREVQNNDSDAYDVLQKFLTYISTGSEFVTDEDGQRVPRTKSEPFDFTKGSPTWEDALKNIYSNIRLRGIEVSKGKTNRGKKERSIDQAYGTRPEGGGAPEGGEGKMPTPEENALGKALDDQAAIREFMSVIDEHVDDMRNSLPPEQKALFDLIMIDEVGGFGSDIKENMGQATAFKEKLENGSPEEKAIYEKNAKRWSGFVGDTRKKLLDSIWSYIENEMSNKDFARLREEFFSDTSPEAVRKMEKDKVQRKIDYQRGIDLRKVLRMREKEKAGSLGDKEKKSLDSLVKKLELELKKEGKTLDEALSAESSKGSPKDEGEGGQSSQASIARRLAVTRLWA
jgi:hypothetical protein